MSFVLDCAGRPLDLQRPRVMGVLNVTPDSFSDGGDFLGCDKALQRARQMVAEGVDIIDVGGESTRPNADRVSLQEELDRVIPVIELLAAEVSVPISIDTSKAEVMGAALAAGAGLINDVNALRAKDALAIAAKSSVPICLMHMQGTPSTMQDSPLYDDIVSEVETFLLGRIAACESAGISRERLILDPGFGFGKSLVHNLALFNGLSRFVEMGLPVLVGVSKKTMIGEVLRAPIEARAAGGLVLATLALQVGASIIRTHDVKATADAVAICEALRK